MLKALRGFFSSDLSIDLGTANTLIYMPEHGIVLNEPSVVAIRKRQGGQDTVEAVGSDAKQMLGRTPMNIEAIRPLKDGVIANFKLTEKMLQHFIAKVHKMTFIRPSPRVLICVPCQSTQVERRAIRESAFSAGARKVMLLDEPMAAALGAGLEVDSPTGCMVVDIGGGTTEIAVISLNGLVYADSVRLGGDRFDETIVNYVRQKYSSVIGLATAEKIKHEIGLAYNDDSSSREYRMHVRNLARGLPQELVITSDEILKALQEPLLGIQDAIKKALENTEPELTSDIAEKGIVLTGGGALLRGMDKLLSEQTELPVVVAEEPMTCVARGGGIALELLDNHKIEFSDD